MVESPPASALKMSKADFLFAFLIVAFNVPPKLGRIYQTLQMKRPYPGCKANILWVPVPPRATRSATIPLKEGRYANNNDAFRGPHSQQQAREIRLKSFWFPCHNLRIYFGLMICSPIAGLCISILRQIIGI